MKYKLFAAFAATAYIIVGLGMIVRMVMTGEIATGGEGTLAGLILTIGGIKAWLL